MTLDPYIGRVWSVAALDAYLATITPVPPVTLEDVAELYREIKAHVTAGISVEVLLRTTPLECDGLGSHIEIVVGRGGPAPVTRRIRYSSSP